ncbi:L,D-transpeptidase family protein [Aliagarivorans taiwanensis]|uniref:L,D-transpeptidase family protein n=1 Tax=Aliagarivorans taiwanensis TaxID=561966 RepID=UPI00047CC63D|nr:L,D-transpeptidase family protein [Aliagarivorans taiwanensis]
MLKYVASALAFLSTSVFALTYQLPDDASRVVGYNQQHIVESGENMAMIAERYEVGFLHLLAANPGIDPFVPGAGNTLLIPTQLLLPDEPREGIVINLAELRLYLYRPDAGEVDVFPIGIGRIGRATPEMTTRISQMRENPSWVPTQKTRDEYAARGEPLPWKVPPGPDNPLGLFAMRLAYGRGEYLIHGTNQSFGVGLRVSAGCIRLFPEHIEYVFGQVGVGTPVKIINQPVKYANEPDGRMMLEIHEPLNRSEEERSEPSNLRLSREQVQFISQDGVDSRLVNQLLRQQQGIVFEVGAQG